MKAKRPVALSDIHYRAREKQPSTSHILERYRLDNEPELVTNEQLRAEAKSLVSNAMQQGLMSLKPITHTRRKRSHKQ